MTEGKRWYALVDVKPVEFRDAPPLGEVLAEDISSKELLSPRSSSWTTWTTGNPPDQKSDGGWEVDV